MIAMNIIQLSCSYVYMTINFNNFPCLIYTVHAMAILVYHMYSDPIVCLYMTI